MLAPLAWRASSGFERRARLAGEPEPRKCPGVCFCSRPAPGPVETDQGRQSNRGAQGRNRTTDTRIFSPLLYRLSYLGVVRRQLYRGALRACPDAAAAREAWPIFRPVCAEAVRTRHGALSPARSNASSDGGSPSARVTAGGVRPCAPGRRGRPQRVSAASDRPGAPACRYSRSPPSARAPGAPRSSGSTSWITGFSSPVDEALQHLLAKGGRDRGPSPRPDGRAAPSR